MASTSSATTVRADLIRWCERVESRDRREAPPTPTLWNREKIGKDVALARELHLAGGAVRKRVTHAPSPSGDAVAVTPGHAWEVSFHVVAYAVRPDAVDAPREEGETGADETDARVPSRARLILSTRADVGGGCGAPHRLILDDRSDGERESSNTAEAAGTTRRERRRPLPSRDDETDARTSPSSSAYSTNAAVYPGQLCVRGLELALASMPIGERCLVRVQPTYAYLHPSCARPPPLGVDVEDDIWLDVESVRASSCATRIRIDATRTRTDGARGQTGDKDGYPQEPPPVVHKTVTREGEGWESPRPPFEIVLELVGRVCAPAGPNEEGPNASSVFAPRTRVRCVSGDGTLPAPLSAAVDTMRVGERSTVWCEPGAYLEDFVVCNRRVPAAGVAAGVEFELALESMVHVRDLFGDGVVFKRREKEGAGEFPADCPVHDCACSVHFSVRVCPSGGGFSGGFSDTAGAINYDTAGADPTVVYDTRDALGEPLQFQLGCGTLPEALETSFRLAVPGEVFRVTLNDATHPRHGYVGEDQPGASAVFAALAEFIGDPKESSLALEFVAELVSFDRPVNWHRASLSAMLDEARKLKDEGNELLAGGKLALARSKYEKTVRNLEGLRGLDPAEHEAVYDLRRKTTLNLAAALQRSGEHAAAIARLEKLLDEDPDDAKALWRRSVSFLATHEHAAARSDLSRCAEIDPSTAEEVRAQLRKVERREIEGAARERAVAEKALG